VLSQAPRDNGSPIKTYILEWDKGDGDGKYHEVYNGNQRQTKVTHKLAPGTKCVFRVKAINDIGPRWDIYFNSNIVQFKAEYVLQKSLNSKHLSCVSSRFKIQDVYCIILMTFTKVEYRNANENKEKKYLQIRLNFGYACEPK